MRASLSFHFKNVSCCWQGWWTAWAPWGDEHKEEKYEMSKGKPRPLTHTWKIVLCLGGWFHLIWEASVCVVSKTNCWSLRFKTVWCLRTIDGLAKTPSSSWETVFVIIRKILIVMWVWSLRIRAAVCYGWLVPTLLWRRPGSWIWNIRLNILQSGNE